MSFSDVVQKHFEDLSSALFHELQGTEELNLNLEGEDTLYARFRNAQVRQNTHVEQKKMEIIFQKDRRRLTVSLDLTGSLELDLKAGRSLLNRARQEFPFLPEDPTVVPFENRGTSKDSRPHAELDFPGLLKNLNELADGTDFTGLLAAGPQVRANRNSAGQNHWFSTSSFFLDYSLFTVNEDQENKAVKSTYSGTDWNSEEFKTGLSSAKNKLSLLRKKARGIEPGKHRTYLAPAAVSELIGMFSWNALSYAAYKKGGCAMARLADGQATLSNLFTLRENFDLGLTPTFNNLGELPPRKVELIEKGELRQFLIGSRTAQEFGVPSNFAEMNMWGHESLRSPEMLGGSLAEKDVLKALGTGLFLGNLHYCNWSDIQTARVTGMTRYACFWVENGEIVCPIRDLRFDESLFRAFGSQLEALTKEQHIELNVETYGSRGVGGKKIPGALLSDFHFTL